MSIQPVPGPWRIERPATIHADGFGLVASVRGSVFDPRTDATCRLIAEAPAMLKAIRMQLRAADEGDADLSMEAFDEFRAILARIDGAPCASCHNERCGGECLG